MREGGAGRGEGEGGRGGDQCSLVLSLTFVSDALKSVYEKGRFRKKNRLSKSLNYSARDLMSGHSLEFGKMPLIILSGFIFFSV